MTDKHNIQIDGYADDNQLRITCKPTIYSLKEHIKLLESCINEIINYMLSEQLKINESKPELILIGIAKQLNTLDNYQY